MWDGKPTAPVPRSRAALQPHGWAVRVSFTVAREKGFGGKVPPATLSTVPKVFSEGRLYQTNGNNTRDAEGTLGTGSCPFSPHSPMERWSSGDILYSKWGGNEVIGRSGFGYIDKRNMRCRFGHGNVLIFMSISGSGCDV